MRMSVKIKSGPNFLYRDLAQFGSASGLGPEGRWFESSNPDKDCNEIHYNSFRFGNSNSVTKSSPPLEWPKVLFAHSLFIVFVDKQTCVNVCRCRSPSTCGFRNLFLKRSLNCFVHWTKKVGGSHFYLTTSRLGTNHLLH